MEEPRQASNLFVEFRSFFYADENTKIVNLAPDVILIRRRKGSLERRYILTELISPYEGLPRAAEIDKLRSPLKPLGAVSRFRQWFQSHFRIPSGGKNV